MTCASDCPVGYVTWARGPAKPNLQAMKIKIETSVQAVVALPWSSGIFQKFTLMLCI